MARLAVKDDVWSLDGQAAIGDGLRAALGLEAVVRVEQNRVHVGIDRPVGWVDWVYESGLPWTVHCPVHGTRCATPFDAVVADEVVTGITAWAVGHG